MQEIADFILFCYQTNPHSVPEEFIQLMVDI